MEDGDDIRHQLVDMLLEKVEADPYPSVTMMDMIEETADEQQRAAYGRVLLAKAQGDTFPSIDMMRRINALG